jgi:hypothetical protein
MKNSPDSVVWLDKLTLFLVNILFSFIPMTLVQVLLSHALLSSPLPVQPVSHP